MTYPRIIFPDIPFKDGELYEPSNGTEGDLFQEGWCWHCKRDKEFREGGWETGEGGCSILANAYASGTVPQWIFKDRQPICTEFEDEAIPDDPLSPEERAAQLALI
jgi:hypothetical protein